MYLWSLAPACDVTPSSSDVLLLSPTNANVVSRGASVHYACQEGYVLTEGKLILACGDDGDLIGQLPVCKRKSASATVLKLEKPTKQTNTQASLLISGSYLFGLFEKMLIVHSPVHLFLESFLCVVFVLEIPCAEIRKRTKIIDIIEYTLKLKWKWAGHIARLKDNRWTRRCTEWQPRRGKRSRGRPSRRWQDDITEKEGTTWIRKATDRRRWKTLTEGYILQWMDKA